MIKISVPNDDHVALRAMAKALEEIAVARGAPAQSVKPEWLGAAEKDAQFWATERLRLASEDLMQAAPAMLQENNVDGSIEIHGKRKDGATHVITSQEKVGDPVDMGDGNFSQGYRIEMEELATTDSTGTPWDERIHSASKALNADGTWRVRRKPKDMDETEWSEYVEEVKTVLLSDHNHREKNEQILEEEYPSVIYKEEPPVTPEGDDFHVDAGVVTEQEIASIPAPPPPPVANFEASLQRVTEQHKEFLSSPKLDDTSHTFPQVMQFLTERHGRITSPQVDQIIADMGLNSIMDLNTQPEHTGPFIARVKAHLGE